MTGRAENCFLEIMHDSEKVRFRPDSPVAKRLEISPDAIGIEICRYRVLWEGEAALDRLDVRFGERQFPWAVSEKEFEAIPQTDRGGANFF